MHYFGANQPQGSRFSTTPSQITGIDGENPAHGVMMIKHRNMENIDDFGPGEGQVRCCLPVEYRFSQDMLAYESIWHPDCLIPF